MKRICTFILFVSAICALPMDAQVMWNLKGGIMQRSFYNDYAFQFGNTERKKRIDWMAGLELEIPLSERIDLQTGIRYRNHLSLIKKGEDFHHYDSYEERNSHIELPLRLTYKQPLGEYFSLHAGVGPYMTCLYDFDTDPFKDFKKNFQVGLEPSIAINWACLSLGATYNIPCFYKGYTDENKPVIMATLGIRFKSHVWKYVGATLLAIASVGAAAAAVWPTNDGYSSYSSGSYSPAYSNSSNSSSSSSTTTNNSTSNIGEQQSYNTDKQTWANYDGMLSAHFNGSRSATRNEVQQWQKKMKDLRTKWKTKGKSFPDSSNENRLTSNCPNASHSH